MPRARLINSPLVRVTCEVRFPGNFAVYDHLAALQSRLDAEFPNLLVPNMRDGEPLALKPYTFSRADGSERVLLAIHSFAFQTARYTVFPEFRLSFTRLWGMFLELGCTPRHATRVGLRYENILPWRASEAKALRIHPWLTFGYSIPSMMPQAIVDHGTNMVLRYDDQSSIRVALEIRRPAVESSEAVPELMVLDLDFFRLGPISLVEIESVIDAGHQAIEEAFFGMLSEDGLRAMEGE